MASALRCFSIWINPCTYGEDEDLCEKSAQVKGHKCLTKLIGIIKRWTSPTDKCSIWRQALCPITESTFYKKYSRCCIDKVVQLIGLAALLICAFSFCGRPWWNETESCLGNECPVMWTTVVVLLYAKNYVVNLVGLVINAALIYGVHDVTPDFVHLWLMWRTFVACLGIVTIGVLLFFNLSVQHDLRPIVFTEIYEVLMNIAIWIAVFAYFQQICECDGAQTLGDDDTDTDGGSSASAGSAPSQSGADTMMLTEGLMDYETGLQDEYIPSTHLMHPSDPRIYFSGHLSSQF